ncbi:MAG: hypothetical protein E3J43_06610 [Candidatus Heimdallarchaeota archaeon]|nr:MAG: hypothetical protein E3J43_06610 [Candidatus Heimdallarchaeota archaeon]
MGVAKRRKMITVDYDGGAAGTTPRFQTFALRGFLLDQMQLHSNAEITYTCNLWEHHVAADSEADLELNGSLIIKDMGMKVTDDIVMNFVLGIDERIKIVLIGYESD